MPTVTLKVSAHDRELWVEAANGEGISLSEWLRRAATTKLASGMLDEGGQRLHVSETSVSLAAKRQLGSEETGIANPTGERSGQPVSSDPNVPVELLEPPPTPEGMGAELERVWNEHGVEEAGKALPPTSEGTGPNDDSSASTPPKAEAEAEVQGDASPTSEENVDSIGDSSDSASAIEKLAEEARQLLEGRPFKPDFKVEKKAKKKRW